MKPMRTRYFFAFIAIAVLLSYSFYVQTYEGFQPCPLCSLQRLAFGLVGLSFLLGFLTYRYKITRLIYCSTGLLFAIAGFALAARQTWIQLYPSSDTSECGVSLQYMLQVLPWHEVAKKILAGTAECSQRAWSLLGFSMAEWSALCFAGLILFSWLMLKRAPKP
jgi:disulfide bond formation protein DsbB